LDIRSASVGALPTFYFIELVDGFALPEAVVADERIRELHSLGAKIIFTANDLLGLQKDLLGGWPNLVTVMQQAHQIGLAEACERAVDLHNREVLAFRALEALVPSFGPDTDPFVHHYVERMHNVMCGFAEFERQAERYRWKELEDSSGRFRMALCTYSET
jgi:hypothetical protein